MKKLYIFLFLFILFMVHSLWFMVCFAHEGDLEFSLDINSSTAVLPKIFRPGIDLSGRGFYRLSERPQTLAAPEALDTWQKDIGFNGVFRLSYNLWELNEAAKDKDLQNKLLANYEDMLKKITDAGGIAIVNIFGTPAGLGKILDKRSPPFDFKAFQGLVKSNIKNLSCDKRYNIWYEVWSAPDLDDFFLGRKQEYLNLYRAVACAIEELEAETKVHIPIGGPSSSWWFQNFDGNTIITPERSLVYELIKFCYNYHLPLDFITWHAYSTDPKTEKEITAYKKTAAELIRAWLSYFHFDRDTPLFVDEWNYDSGANVLPERSEKSNISASFLLKRLENMQEAGLDYQTYFSLEDFQNNKEGVVSNVGAFWFDSEASEYKGGPKSIYNAFRMLGNLGGDMFLTPKLESEFVGGIATKDKDDGIAILIYNYIDPQIAMNYLSRNIAGLNDAERRALLNLIKSGQVEKIMRQELDISRSRVSNKVKALLKKAQELNEQAKKFMNAPRNMKINLKNLKDNYLYQRYTIDSSCSVNCKFIPVEEKEVGTTEYQETLSLNPYSANLLILKKKPREPEAVPPATTEQPANQGTAK